MPEYLAPGVYIEEINFGRQPVEAVPTATAAFVGATAKGPLNRATAVNSYADYRATFDTGPISSPMSVALHLFFANGGREAIVVRIKPSGRGRAARPTPADIAGGAKTKTGLHALGEDASPGLLLTPDAAEMSAAQWNALAKPLMAFCEERYIFCLLDPPRGLRSPRGPVRAVADWARQKGTPRHTNTAVYFPRISIPDPSRKTGSILVSPSGAVAGIYARTDARRGVWKAPAGVDAHLRGADGLETDVNTRDTSLLQRVSINPIRRFNDGRIIVWGARTFPPAGANPEWKYVPVRRTALMLENSLDRGLSWAVFEPNGEPLWAQVRLAVSSFMNQFFRAGAFQGTRAEHAYFVRCDRTTMTQDDIDNGRLICEIGFAPVRPAEFVIFRILQKVSEQP